MRCTCTPEYFLHDENQWEPGYTCQSCINKQNELYDSIDQLPDRLVYPVVDPAPVPADDLPFLIQSF